MEKTPLRPSLRDLLFTLFRYKWVAAGTFAVVLAAGILLTAVTPRVYEIKTRVFVSVDVTLLKLNQSDAPTRITLEQLIATEAEIARSLPVIEEALAASGQDTQGRTPGASTVISGLQVLPVRNTTLVEFKLEYPDPVYGAKLVNHIVAAYMKRRGTANPDDQKAGQYEAHLAGINARIDSLEAATSQFHLSNDISRVETQIDKDLDRRTFLVNSRTTLERELIGLRQETADLDALQDDFEPSRIPAYLVERNRQLRSWLDEYLEAERSWMALAGQLQEGATELRLARERREELKLRLRTQVAHHADLQQKEVQAKERELGVLNREIMAIEGDSRRLAQANNRSIDLGKQLEDLRSIRTVLVRQLEETKIRSMESGTFRVEQVDQAHPPQKPVRPNVAFNLFATLLLSLAAGAGLPLYLQAMSSSLVSDHDVTRATGLPVLCHVRQC